MCLSQLTVFEKKIGPIILLTLTVHHVPTSMSCNGRPTSCVSLVLYAYIRVPVCIILSTYVVV